jgi:hypothetical protein
LLAPRPTPTLEDQASVFISPRGRVAQLYPQTPGTHFSRLLRHAWVMVRLFLFPRHHTGNDVKCCHIICVMELGGAVIAQSVLRWAKDWTVGVLGFDSRRWAGIFLFATASRTALAFTQPPMQWVPGALSLGVKRPMSKNAWSYTSILQYDFMAWCLVTHRDNLLYFTL